MTPRTVQKLFDLSGKTALVTGGSRGLGLQMAHALGEAGARIMLSSRKAEDLEEAALERLFSLHRERLRGLTVAEDFTPEARLQVGRAWHQGAGRREIRRQNLQGLLWTLVALAILALLFGSRGE